MSAPPMQGVRFGQPPAPPQVSDRDKQLIAAVREGDLAAVEAALDNGASPNAQMQVAFPVTLPNGQTTHGMTNVTMIGAALDPNFGGVEAKVVELLIKRGARLVSSPTSASGSPTPALPHALEPMPYIRQARGNRTPYDAALVLIANGANVEEEDHDKATVLSTACQEGHVLGTRLLLEAAADPNHGKRNGSTPCYKAAQGGHADCLRLLIAAGARVDAQFHSGATPLLIAAGSGKAEAVKLLLAAAADPNMRASDGNTPRTVAQGACRALLEAACTAAAPVPPLVNGTRVSLHGLQARADLNGMAGVVIGFDASKGRCTVQLRDGSSMALKPANLQQRDTPAAAATPCGAVPVTKEECVEALMSANPQTLRNLLSKGDIDPDLLVDPPPLVKGLDGKISLLCVACLMQPSPTSPASFRARGFPDMLQALLDAGASVDGGKGGGTDAKTPLMIAAQGGQKSYVQLLLARGADVHARNAHGADAAMQACQCDSPQGAACLQVLLAGGADIEGVDDSKYTLLIACAEWGRPVHVGVLIKAGARLDDSPTIQGAGYTALAAAASSGHVAVVRQLLKAGADRSIPWVHTSYPGSAPKTPRQWAKGPGGNDEVVELLTSLDDMLADAEAAGVFDDTEGMAGRCRLQAGDTLDGKGRGLTSAADFEAARSGGEFSAEQLMAELRARMRAVSSIKSMETCESGKALFDAFCAGGYQQEPDYPPRAAETTPVLGGRVLLQGLKSQPGLNGKEGNVLSYNADGKGRFGVRVKGKVSYSLIALRPQSLVAVDHDPPPRCEHAPAEFVAALQKELREIDELRMYEVVDWTDVAARVSDPMQLIRMAATGQALSRSHRLHLFYVQRTAENEAFFVCEREVEGVNRGDQTAAPPWLIFSGRRHGDRDGPVGGTLLPPQGPDCSKVAFMVRFVRTVLSRTVECGVCFEPQDVMGASQLPCVHILCNACLKKLFPLDQLGLTCPTCKSHFPQHKLIDMKKLRTLNTAMLNQDVAIVMVSGKEE